MSEFKLHPPAYLHDAINRNVGRSAHSGTEAIAQAVWDALLDHGAVRVEDWIDENGEQDYPLCLVIPVTEVAS